MDLSTPPLVLALGLLLVPAVLAGLACLWGARRGQLGALGVAVGYAVGHGASLGGLPGVPPATSNEALFWCGALGGAYALVSCFVRRLGARAALAALGGALAAALLLRARLSDMSAPELALELLGTALAAGLGTLALERVAERERGPEAALLAAVMAIATAACVGLTGSVIYAQFAASLTAVLVAALVAGWLARGADYTGAVASLAVLQVASLALAASHFSSLPPVARWALTFAPACTLAATRGGALGRWVALVAALGFALALAWKQHAASASSAY